MGTCQMLDFAADVPQSSIDGRRIVNTLFLPRLENMKATRSAG